MIAMPIVVVDANVIRSSPLLRNRSWSSLIDHSAEWNLRIAVPEIVLMESINVVRRGWDKARTSFEALKFGQCGLGEVQSKTLADIANHYENYPEALSSRLDQIGAEITKLPHIDHLEIARRWALTPRVGHA